MQLDPRTPVLIGGGQWNNRVDDGAEAVEPVDLIAEAARRAADDAGTTDAGKVLAAVESARIVGMLSWRYPDPGRLVGERIGAADLRQTVLTSMGGNTPQALVNASCREILAGDLDVVLIGGAEAWRTRSAAKGAGVSLDWTVQPDDAAPDVVFGNMDPLDMVHPLELQRGVVAPVQVYPMFESALRARAGATAEAWQARIGGLWSRFSEIAAGNPDAWLRQAYSPEEVATASLDNRMIGAPYPKRLNSNNAVEQGAVVLLCSVEAAERLGVPRERWVFPWAGTDGKDAGHASTRRDFHSSPAIGVAGRRVLELAGVGPDDLALTDLYSCFPSAVQLGAQELGLGIDRDLTVTGGLSFAGGPWNNYVTHSIATMARLLREQPGAIGLITANGGLVQKHAFGVYSTEPPAAAFRSEKPQDEIDAAAGTPVVPADPDWAGPATVEAYTVMHDRDSTPEKGIVAVRTATGERTWAATDDPTTMQSMLTDEWVGHPVHVDAATFTAE